MIWVNGCMHHSCLCRHLEFVSALTPDESKVSFALVCSCCGYERSNATNILVSGSYYFRLSPKNVCDVILVCLFTQFSSLLLSFLLFFWNVMFLLLSHFLFSWRASYSRWYDFSFPLLFHKLLMILLTSVTFSFFITYQKRS